MSVGLVIFSNIIIYSSKHIQPTMNQVQLVTGQPTGRACMHSAHIVSKVCMGIAFKLVKTTMKKCMLFYR